LSLVGELELRLLLHLFLLLGVWFIFENKSLLGFGSFKDVDLLSQLLAVLANNAGS